MTSEERLFGSLIAAIFFGLTAFIGGIFLTVAQLYLAAIPSLVGGSALVIIGMVGLLRLGMED